MIVIACALLLLAGYAVDWWGEFVIGRRWSAWWVAGGWVVVMVATYCLLVSLPWSST